MDENGEHPRAVIQRFGNVLESALKHNDAFAFVMTALWCVTQQVFYHRSPETGEQYLGEIIAQQATQPDCQGFQSFDKLPVKPQLMGDNGKPCDLPPEFERFVAKRTSFANLLVEFDQDAFNKEVATVSNALILHSAGPVAKA